MNVFFHSNIADYLHSFGSLESTQLPLSRFETRFGLANYVDPAPTPYNLTIRMPRFQSFKTGYYFHGLAGSRKLQQKGHIRSPVNGILC